MDAEDRKEVDRLVTNAVTAAAQGILSQIDDLKHEVIGMRADVLDIRVRMAAAEAREKANDRILLNHQQTLYGHKGNNGLVGAFDRLEARLSTIGTLAWGVVPALSASVGAAAGFLLQRFFGG